MTEQRTEDYRIGSWERPDPAGIVRRGEAVSFRGYGEPPLRWVGKGLDGVRCARPAVMEVYGIVMCEAHGRRRHPRRLRR